MFSQVYLLFFACWNKQDDPYNKMKSLAKLVFLFVCFCCVLMAETFSAECSGKEWRINWLHFNVVRHYLTLYQACQPPLKSMKPQRKWERSKGLSKNSRPSSRKSILSLPRMQESKTLSCESLEKSGVSISRISCFIYHESHVSSQGLLMFS